MLTLFLNLSQMAWCPYPAPVTAEELANFISSSLTDPCLFALCLGVMDEKCCERHWGYRTSVGDLHLHSCLSLSGC